MNYYKKLLNNIDLVSRSGSRLRLFEDQFLAVFDSRWRS